MMLKIASASLTGHDISLRDSRCVGDRIERAKLPCALNRSTERLYRKTVMQVWGRWH